MKAKSFLFFISALFLILFNSCEDTKELSEENYPIAKASNKTPPIDWDSEYDDPEGGDVGSGTYTYSGSTVNFPKEPTFSNSFKDGLITVVIAYNASSNSNKPIISGVSFKNSTPSLTSYKAEDKIVYGVVYDANKNLLEFKIRIYYSITTRVYGSPSAIEYHEYYLNFVRAN